MDLASGARRVFAMMEHTTKAGESKIVESLTVEGRIKKAGRGLI